MPSLDQRVSMMEARHDNLSEQIVSLRTEMGEFRAEMRDFRAEMRAEIRDLRQDVNQKFLWMLGIQMATLLTIIGALISVTYRA